ncbi:MAG: type I DNA topoisomerase [Planctomycetaceae bacterium]|nr:type I DNA topoisomerase [Planctomycetota bacterium]NUN51434.1 type I DNA topoisomerase [Planctomycetaceae bacterium]
MPAKRKTTTKPKAAKPAKARAAAAGGESPSAKPAAKRAPARPVPRTGRNLVVVESPAKAKTIGKYLGKDFVVKASMGHVRDLPGSEFGFDPEEGFEATYEIIPSKKKVVAELRKLAASAPKVYLATDLDREGEAIAWHLSEALSVPPEFQARVTFNEITRRAIQKAFEEPRSIDRDKVDAQQARRFLDRMMGYKLSPLLWRNAGPNLSAGRVQSVALRILVEREREIRAFRPEVYWTVEARFAKEGSPPTPPAPPPGEDGKQPPTPFAPGEFPATLVEVDGAKAALAEEAAASGLLRRLEGAAFRIASVTRERKSEKAPPPFTTSTLQQQASIRLHFSAKRTMNVAQRLYQGVEMGAEGPVALITYMRTDSVALSDDAVKAGRDSIRSLFGDRYLPGSPNRFKAGKRAQEAHEAIRPTDPSVTPERAAKHLERDEARLYELIWRRFMACQMTPSETDVTVARTAAAGCVFESRGRTPIFDGWRRAWPSKGEKEDAELPPLAEGEPVEDRGIRSDRHETQPPPRFTEASLVKTLEKEGIGRPSTYAAIISTIVDRNYVTKERTRFRPTALGEVVNDLLVPFFDDLINVKYSSHMEEELDEVEASRIPWKKVLEEFWTDFSRDLARAKKEMKPIKDLPAPEGTPPCEKCGSPMVRKVWRGREFLGCSAYPACKSTRKVGADGEAVPAAEPTSHVCAKCGKPMVLRYGRRGRFLACSGYPECRNAKDVDEAGNPIQMPEVEEKCDKCGADMVARMGRRGPFLACSAFPKCRNAKDLPGAEKVKRPEPKDAGLPCPDCGKPLMIRMSRRGPFAGCSGYPKCRRTLSMEKLQAAGGGGAPPG